MVGWGTQAFDDNYTIWTAGGTGIGGLMTLPDQANEDERAAALALLRLRRRPGALRARRRAAEVLNGPMEVPGGDRVTQCLDPQGATFALHGK